MSDNNTIEEMWRELEAYQPFADADGHGDTWRTMCEKRTKDDALMAADAARAAAFAVPVELADAAIAAMWATVSAAAAAVVAEAVVVNVNCHASLAIEDIRKAKEGKGGTMTETETQTDQFGIPVPKMYTVEYIVMIDGEDMDETYHEIVWARDPDDAVYKAQEMFYENENIDHYSTEFKWVEVYENLSVLKNTKENER